MGGWKLSASNVSFRGFPVTASSPANYSATVFAFSGAARPYQTEPLRIVNRSTNHYFGTATAGVFSPQPQNAFGNVRPGSLRAPSYEHVDMAISEAFPIWREHNLNFCADFFNLLNIADYSAPDSGVTVSNFG